MNEQKCRVYEQLGVSGLGDGLIRPGGLAMTERAVALSSLGPGSRMLDMGCGTGATLRYLVDRCGFRAVGIDPSLILLNEGRGGGKNLPAAPVRGGHLPHPASRIQNPAVARARGEHLPFADACLDGILAECSLSVADNVSGVLGECRRILKVKGLLIIHDVYARNPDGVSAVGDLPLECCLTGAVSRDEWRARLDANGFELRLWEDHSKALKEFAARLIFSHGSMDEFWRRFGSRERKDDAKAIQHAVSKARPGYFLLIARK